MNLLCLKLQAHHAGENIHRFYTLRMGQDLFGDWHIVANYGRHGRRGGQEKRWLMPCEQTAKGYLQKILHKRLNAHKRIGVDYTLLESSVDPVLQDLVL